HVLPLTWGKVTTEPLVPSLVIKTWEEILSWSKHSLLLALTQWFLPAHRSSHVHAVSTTVGSHSRGLSKECHLLPSLSLNATLAMSSVVTAPTFPL
ncbi:hypothetical protein N307_00834, partial [Dryobates pubescens]